MHWTARYVGLPFVDGGRDELGLDCWGLVSRVLASETGIDVPSYGDTSAADLTAVARHMGRDSTREPWAQVAEPREFDVVLMAGRAFMNGRPQRVPIHVGVAVDAERVLHVERGTDSVIVPLTHPTVRSRILGFYRHRDLA